MARQIVFTDSGFWKYSWAHLVMSMTESCRWVMQCHLRARRPQASNKGLRPRPLRTEMSPVSLNVLMMLCTVDDDICKTIWLQIAIWRWWTLFLKYSTIFECTLSQIGEPMPIFTSERLWLFLNSMNAKNELRRTQGHRTHPYENWDVLRSCLTDRIVSA